MPRTEELLEDLAVEQAALEALVQDLSASEWSRPTPAPGWDIATSVGHLVYFDEAAALALGDPERFEALRRSFLDLDERGAAGDLRPDEVLGRELAPVQLLERWRRARRSLEEAAWTVDPAVRVPWFGPPMSPASFLTARIMETWAHGQDVRDALGEPPLISARLRHVCHLGVAARPYAFAVHQQADPGGPIRVEVQGPSGEVWTWGPADAPDVVRGSALDLALVVTQRRNLADTSLVVQGQLAQAWLAVAQAFAGPAGAGRPPGCKTPGASRGVQG